MLKYWPIVVTAWDEVLRGGGSDDQGQVRRARNNGKNSRPDSGWEKLGPSDRQGADSPQERRHWAAPKVAEALDVALGTVYRIKQRFTEEGLDGALWDRRQVNRHRKLDDRSEAHLIALACSPAPEGHDHWTLRLLAGKVMELGLASSPTRECVSVSKKRSQAVAEAGVVHPQGERRVRGQHGGRAGPVRRTV